MQQSTKKPGLEIQTRLCIFRQGRALALDAEVELALHVLHALAQGAHGIVKFLLQAVHEFMHRDNLVHTGHIGAAKRQSRVQDCPSWR